MKKVKSMITVLIYTKRKLTRMKAKAKAVRKEVKNFFSIENGYVVLNSNI
jgi:hypothetical protein